MQPARQSVFANARPLPALRSWFAQSLGFVGRDVLVATVIANLLSLGLPMVTLQVYDRIIPNQAQGTFTYLLFGLIGVIVLDVFLKMSRATITGFLGAQYEHRAGTQALGRLMWSKLEDVEAQPVGTHLDRIAGIDAVRDFYSGPSALAIVDLPFALLFLFLIAFIGGWLAMVPLVVLLAALAFAVYLGAGLRHAVSDRRTWDDRRYNFIVETLSGIHTVKGLAMEPLMQRRYERLLTSSSEASHRVALLAGLSHAVAGFFGQFALASVAAAGVYIVVQGDLTIGGLAACILLSGRTVQPVLRALSAWTRFQNITVAEEKMDELEQFEAESEGGPSRDPVERITLHDASFRYSPDSPDIIKSVNLEVACGDMVCIKGTNGSGKSTLLSMLTGRLTPTDGQLSINAQPASNFSTAHLRRQVAFLSQQPALLQGTVLDNLTFFSPERYMDQALDYAARLGLDQVFAQLPDGYDTMVGEAAASALPRGVAQRIAIARVLARNPKFLLFDEVNSSLDGPGEELFRKTLEAVRSDVGIVFVTYRPSLLRMADRLYSLEDGVLAPLPPMGSRAP